eukprot:TRINITY_DN2968_c1_g2_i1.p1 TRINITY_DN2968_c1_g2~~TRINITY_DN2968_c1_g2_i1.p1  ORF type:complete len:243 (+),score=60.22 TRINITY_DN2968_c1_g2_i1:38-766(+)
MTTKKSKSGKTGQHVAPSDTFQAVRHLPSYDDRVLAINKWIVQEIKEPKKTGVKEKDTKTNKTVYDTNSRYMTATELLVRLVKYGLCSKEVFTVMVILLRRLKKRFLGKFTKNNIYKCMSVAFITAAKLRDDSHYTLKYYSQITGISISQLFQLETSFLVHLSWDLSIAEESYERTACAFDKYVLPVSARDEEPPASPVKTKRKVTKASKSVTSKAHTAPRKAPDVPVVNVSHFLQDHACYV